MLDEFEATVEPLFKRILTNIEEGATLSLPKLMSGEIQVKDTEKMVEAAV
jgi:hypothetical protein